MKKPSVAKISDGLFIGFAVFAVIFVPTAFYTRNRPLSAVVAIVGGALAAALFFKRTDKKNASSQIKKEDEEAFLKCGNAFAFVKGEALNTVVSLYRKEGKNPEITDDGSIVVGKDFTVLRFTPEPIGLNFVAESYLSKPDGYDLVVLGREFTAECSEFIKNSTLAIRLVTLAETFPLLKEHGLLPESGFVPKKTKVKFKEAVAASFDKRKAGKFALYGGMLLVTSYFAFFPVWYIVSGCLFLVYAAAIKAFAKPKIEKFTL